MAKTQYEYMAQSSNVMPPPAEAMNRFGDDGWQLVQIVFLPDECIIYFMREKSAVILPTPEEMGAMQ